MRSQEVISLTPATANRYSRPLRAVLRAAAPVVAVAALAGCSDSPPRQVNEATGVVTSDTKRPAATTSSEATTTTQPPETTTTVPETTTTTAKPISPEKKIDINSFQGLNMTMSITDFAQKDYTMEESCGGNYIVRGPFGMVTAHITPNGYADQYATRDPEATTDAGVHVGSFRDDVMNAYGTYTQSAKLQIGIIDEFLTYSPPEGKTAQEIGAVMHFVMSKNVVVEIWETRPGDQPYIC